MRIGLLLLFVSVNSFAQTAVQCGIEDPIAAAKVGATIKNFSQVAPGIYRGSRPREPADFAFLKAQGIKTILSLEAMPWNVCPESDRVEGQFVFLNVGIVASPFEPDENHVSRAVQVLMDPSVRRPIFVHCAAGRDRTSLIVGLYRISAEGCSPANAWKEMRGFGINQGFFLHGLRTSFIRQSGWNPDKPAANADGTH